MTNREKFKRTFSVLRTSDRLMEVKAMENTKRVYIRRFVPVAAALILVLGMATAAYATDVGGIQRIVQIWIHGEQTNATMEIGDGQYSMTYKDENGKIQEQSGGGVAFEADGTERPMTEEELMEDIDCPEVMYEGSKVKVYYHDQVIDITDKFKDKVCYVKIVEGKETIYMTVKYNNGFATSPSGYIQPDKFNTVK